MSSNQTEGSRFVIKFRVAEKCKPREIYSAPAHNIKREVSEVLRSMLNSLEQH